MSGERFSRSFTTMQESVLGMFSFPRSTARLPHVTMQALAVSDEPSDTEEERSCRFCPIAPFLLVYGGGLVTSTLFVHPPCLYSLPLIHLRVW